MRPRAAVAPKRNCRLFTSQVSGDLLEQHLLACIYFALVLIKFSLKSKAGENRGE